MKKLWFIKVEFKLQDMWIGAFWKKDDWRFDLWICLLPTIPIHIGYTLGVEH